MERNNTGTLTELERTRVMMMMPRPEKERGGWIARSQTQTRIQNE